jgi:hypothetical protein
MSNEKAVLRYFNFTLSHCFKGTTCHRWRSDYVTEYCGDKDMMTQKYKCTRFKEGVGMSGPDGPEADSSDGYKIMPGEEVRDG